MTPKSKEELHDILLALQDGDLGLNEALWKIVAWHQQELEQAVREARLDELHRLKVQFISSHWERLRAEVNSWAKYVDRRIAELQSTIKEDKSNEQTSNAYSRQTTVAKQQASDGSGRLARSDG